MFYKKHLQISAFFIALSMLTLEMSGKLSLYIHPRYIFFSTAMGIISLIFICTSWREKKTTNYYSQEISKVGVALSCLLLIMLYAPPQSLSQKTAQNRLQQNPNVAAHSKLSYDAFSQDFTYFDLQDWYSYLASQPAEDRIIGKKAHVNGFIFDASGTRYLARFQLSCCAVDATPLSLPLENDDVALSLTPGNWYEITGSFIKRSEKYVLKITVADPIPQPEDPYVF